MDIYFKWEYPLIKAPVDFVLVFTDDKKPPMLPPWMQAQQLEFSLLVREENKAQNPNQGCSDGYGYYDYLSNLTAFHPNSDWVSGIPEPGVIAISDGISFDVEAIMADTGAIVSQEEAFGDEASRCRLLQHFTGLYTHTMESSDSGIWLQDSGCLM